MLSAICDNSTNCYKQKAHFNDSMSDRKPLIFTRDSFSLLFGMFYTSWISFPARGAPRSPGGAPTPVASLYLIYSYHPKHMIGFWDSGYLVVFFYYYFILLLQPQCLIEVNINCIRLASLVKFLIMIACI